MVQVKYGQLSLGEVIEMLEAENPNTPMPVGFGEPCSYRGYYEQVAFEIEYDTTVEMMLAEVRSAVGQSFEGYKGGSYRMRSDTPVWIVEDYSDCGEELGSLALSLMLELSRRSAGGSDRG